MAPLTEVVRPKAEVDGNGAAEHALPVDMLLPMLVTDDNTGAKSLKLAVLADKVLLRGTLLDSELLLALNHAAEVGLLTLVALIEGAFLHGEAEKVTMIGTLG